MPNIYKILIKTRELLDKILEKSQKYREKYKYGKVDLNATKCYICGRHMEKKNVETYVKMWYCKKCKLYIEEI